MHATMIAADNRRQRPEGDAQKERYSEYAFAAMFKTIPKESAAAIAAFAERLRPDPYADRAYYPLIMRDALERELPPALTADVRVMAAAKPGAPGLMLVENFPVDEEIPKGENVAERLSRKGRVSEKVMLGFAALMGYMPHANPGDQGGSVPNQVAPVRGKEHTPTGQGQESLDWHVETPYLQDVEMPKFLMLVGLEGDPEAKTSYLFPQKMLAAWPEWVREQAKRPVFRIHSGSAFEAPTEGVFSLLHTDAKGRMQLRLFEGNLAKERISVVDPERNKAAVQALDHIQESFRAIHADPERGGSGEYGAFSLQKGQALIINNAWGRGAVAGVMHGRAGKVANFSRWLQRIFMVDPTPEYKQEEEKGYRRAKADLDDVTPVTQEKASLGAVGTGETKAATEILRVRSCPAFMGLVASVSARTELSKPPLHKLARRDAVIRVREVTPSVAMNR